MAKQPFAPVIRVAPLGELKVFVITEGELDELERGSPASTYLNLALFFWGVAISLFASLLATTTASEHVFIVFTIFFCGTLISAVVFTVLWLIQHRTSVSLIKRIRGRMPPPPATQESTSVKADSVLPGSS